LPERITTVVQIKRVYNEPHSQDGIRILVDRVWPRGCTKERARLDAWRKDLAPSPALRKWFGHDPAKWEEFCARYRIELKEPEPRRVIEELARLAHKHRLTLLFGAADTEHNQAVVLQEVIERAGKYLC